MVFLAGLVSCSRIGWATIPRCYGVATRPIYWIYNKHTLSTMLRTYVLSSMRFFQSHSSLSRADELNTTNFPTIVGWVLRLKVGSAVWYIRLTDIYGCYLSLLVGSPCLQESSLIVAIVNRVWINWYKIGFSELVSVIPSQWFRPSSEVLRSSGPERSAPKKPGS